MCVAHRRYQASGGMSLTSRDVEAPPALSYALLSIRLSHLLDAEITLSYCPDRTVSENSLPSLQATGLPVLVRRSGINHSPHGEVPTRPLSDGILAPRTLLPRGAQGAGIPYAISGITVGRAGRSDI